MYIENYWLFYGIEYESSQAKLESRTKEKEGEIPKGRKVIREHLRWGYSADILGKGLPLTDPKKQKVLPRRCEYGYYEISLKRLSALELPRGAKISTYIWDETDSSHGYSGRILAIYILARIFTQAKVLPPPAAQIKTGKSRKSCSRMIWKRSTIFLIYKIRIYSPSRKIYKSHLCGIRSERKIVVEKITCIEHRRNVEKRPELSSSLKFSEDIISWFFTLRKSKKISLEVREIPSVLRAMHRTRENFKKTSEKFWQS